MPLSYEAGDLLAIRRKQGIICHQVNTQGAIGGLNRAICGKFRGNAVMLQGIQFGTVRTLELTFGDELVTVANIASQRYPGRADQAAGDSYAQRRQALSDCLIKLGLELEPNQRLYVPYCIGCGMAGDNWPEVAAMLDQLPVAIVAMVPYWAEQDATLKGYLKAETPQLAF